MTSLIVDLRNNSGGYLTSVVEMVDYLLPADKVITTIEGRDGGGTTYKTSTEGKDYPIVTLINEGSASASEIFAAAMKEAGGYEVIGTTSYGKGTVQVSMPLDDHSSLKLQLKYGKHQMETGLMKRELHQLSKWKHLIFITIIKFI